MRLLGRMGVSYGALCQLRWLLLLEGRRARARCAWQRKRKGGLQRDELDAGDLKMDDLIRHPSVQFFLVPFLSVSVD